MSIAKRNSEAAKAWAEKRRELKERALLMERRSSAPRRSRLSNGEETKMSSKFSASRSHEANTAYIDDFKAGIADMYLALEETSGKTREGGFEPKSQGRAEDITQISSSARSRSAVYDSSGYPPSGHSDKRVPDRTRRRESQQDKGCRSEKISHGKILLANELMKDTAGGGAGDGWYRGPLDPAGHLINLSDRNLLCCSVLGDEAVFGCADHALYCVDLSREFKKRQLYGSRSNPSAGHKEWVSVVSHTAYGDIVSGGMDGKLCLWPRGGGNPEEVQAHAGPISAMKADAESRVVTSGYGGALRVWDCRASGGDRVGAPRLSGELSDRGLPAPCMDFAWHGRRVVTAHRDGCLGVFDIETGVLVSGGCRAAHCGHVTALFAFSDTEGGRGGGCFVSGGQDGFIRVWDERVGKPEGGIGETGLSAAVMETPAHRGTTGIGAVGGIVAAGGWGNRLASFGADKRICMLELRGGRVGSDCDYFTRRGGGLRSSLAISHVFNEHKDFIYCMGFLPPSGITARAGGSEGGGVLVTGGGDGMLLAHDLGSMRLLYGLGCCRTGAVRCAVAGEERLTVGGDDGNAMIYSFGGRDYS